MSERAFQKNIVTGQRKDHSEYPAREYDVLKGFKTWTPADAFGLEFEPDKRKIVEKIESHEDYRTGPIGYGYNIERFGLAYGTSQDEFLRFWSEVSRCTEPFVVWHSTIQHEFQRLAVIQLKPQYTVWSVGTVKLHCTRWRLNSPRKRRLLGLNRS